MDQPRTSQRYEPKQATDEEALVKQILELVGEYPRYGYRFIAAKLRQAGWKINNKWRAGQTLVLSAFVRSPLPLRRVGGTSLKEACLSSDRFRGLE